jgi:hypothetical protein
LELVVSKTQSSLAGFSVKVKKNLRAISSAVNPKFLCNSKIAQRKFSGAQHEYERRGESLLARRCGDRASVVRGESGESQQKFPQERFFTEQNLMGADNFAEFAPLGR